MLKEVLRYRSYFFYLIVNKKAQFTPDVDMRLKTNEKHKTTTTTTNDNNNLLGMEIHQG